MGEREVNKISKFKTISEMKMKDVQATIEIDLSNELDKLWENLDKKARWGVKKARKEGLVVEDAQKEDFKEFYRIYAETCKRGEIPCISFEGLMGMKGKLFIVRKGKIIAGAFVKIDGEKVVLELNGSDPEFQNLQPNNLLYWHIIEFGKKQGAKVFDLGGYQLKASGKLREVNRFKERWGGKVVIKEISGNLFWILGRKIIRNFPFVKRIRDKLRMRASC